jgi:enoyl-CoA hydratase/carnithine racemase
MDVRWHEVLHQEQWRIMNRLSNKAAIVTGVNRALPDAELDGFVDALARRIASFDRRAIAAAKNLINQVSLPSADQLLDAISSFETALTGAEAQRLIQTLLERGLQQDVDFENRWPEVLGTLVET